MLKSVSAAAEGGVLPPTFVLLDAVPPARLERLASRRRRRSGGSSRRYPQARVRSRSPSAST